MRWPPAIFARKYLGEAKIASAEKAAEKIVGSGAAGRDHPAGGRVELKDELHQLRTQGRPRSRSVGKS